MRIGEHMNKELLEVALRVLAGIINGKSPEPSDVQMLCDCSEEQLPESIDDLARQAVQRELAGIEKVAREKSLPSNSNRKWTADG